MVVRYLGEVVRIKGGPGSGDGQQGSGPPEENAYQYAD
jgi:hypothetical protein